MPKSKGKGGKNRRRGKNEADVEKRELEFKEDGQDYAKVTRMLGNGRLEAICADGVKRLCHIRGKMRKKVWISVGDIILVGLRDFQDNKADVILKVSSFVCVVLRNEDGVALAVGSSTVLRLVRGSIRWSFLLFLRSLFAHLFHFNSTSRMRLPS